MQFFADYFIFDIAYTQTQIVMICLLVSLNLVQGLEFVFFQMPKKALAAKAAAEAKTAPESHLK